MIYNTKPLSKTEYPTKNIYNLENYIKKLVQRDETEIETVVDLQGTAGRPIYQPCEVVFN